MLQAAATSYPPISARPPTPTPKPQPAAKPSAKAPVDHAAVRAVVGQMPSPTGSAYGQAQRVVAGELNPLLSHLIAGYTSQGAAGAAAIKAVTEEYAKQLAGIAPQVGQDYAGAEQGTAQTDASLASLVHGGGLDDANALASRLASIGAPEAVNPVVAQLGGQATGAAGAVLGTGSAALDALLASGAAQQAEAAKLPATAQAAGLQQLGSYQGALTTAENKDIAALTDKAPGLVQSAAGTIIGQGEKTAAINAANKRSSASITAANQRSDASQATQRRKMLVATILGTNIDPVTGLLTPTGVAALRKLGVPTTGGVAGSAGAGIVKTNTTTAARTSHDDAVLQQKQAHDAVLENQGWARVAIAQTNAGTAQGRLALAKTKQAAAKGKGSGSLTQNETARLLKGWHDGSIKDVRIAAINPDTGKQATNINGAPQYSTVTKTVGQVGYVQAIQGLVSLGKTLPEAIKATNGAYGDQMEASIEEFASTAVSRGMDPAAALRLGSAQGVFPPAALTAAIKSAYAQIPTVYGSQPGGRVVSVGQ